MWLVLQMLLGALGLALAIGFAVYWWVLSDLQDDEL
jgi:hypothetical protein